MAPHTESTTTKRNLYRASAHIISQRKIPERYSGESKARNNNNNNNNKVFIRGFKRTLKLTKSIINKDNC